MNIDFPYIVDTDTVKEFADNGFVTTAGIFSESELSQYEAAVSREVARRTETDVRGLADKSVYEQTFIQCMRLWETSADVVPLTCHAALAGIAAQLLQVDSVRLWQDQALYKEPGGRETTPHQDQTFWPIGEAQLISAWIPFDDVTIASGAMAYVPGSHKVGRLKVVDITHSTEAYDILSDPALNGAQPQWMEVPAGTVVWHHGFTVHEAAANQSSDTRRVFTVVYIDANARRAKPWPVFPLDRDGVAVGELIQGPGLPTVWPPGTDYPKSPVEKGQPTGPQY